LNRCVDENVDLLRPSLLTTDAVSSIYPSLPKMVDRTENSASFVNLGDIDEPTARSKNGTPGEFTSLLDGFYNKPPDLVSIGLPFLAQRKPPPACVCSFLLTWQCHRAAVIKLKEDTISDSHHLPTPAGEGEGQAVLREQCNRRNGKRCVVEMLRQSLENAIIMNTFH
jgi:hypothetical protein